jgi:hypothetical protein
MIVSMEPFNGRESPINEGLEINCMKRNGERSGKKRRVGNVKAGGWSMRNRSSQELRS